MNFQKAIRVAAIVTVIVWIAALIGLAIAIDTKPTDAHVPIYAGTANE